MGGGVTLLSLPGPWTPGLVSGTLTLVTLLWLLEGQEVPGSPRHGDKVQRGPEPLCQGRGHPGVMAPTFPRALHP